MHQSLESFNIVIEEMAIEEQKRPFLYFFFDNLDNGSSITTNSE